MRLASASRRHVAKIADGPGNALPDRTWDELEGLPQPLRNAAHRAIFHLLEEPVLALPTRFPKQIRYQALTVLSDGLTIWYTVTESPDGHRRPGRK